MATDPNGNPCKTSCCVFNFYTQTVYNPNPPRLWSRFNYVCPCYPTNPCLLSLSSWKQSDKNTNSFICLSSGDDCTNAIAGGALLTGIWYSTNGGKNWTQSTQTPPGTQVNAGAIFSLSSSSNGNIAIAGIVAGIFGSGLWYSSDGGQIWRQSNITSGSYSFTSISSDGSKAIAGSPSGILYSTDGGQIWNSSSLTPPGATNFTSVSISSDGTNAVAVSNTLSNAELWYSSNGGFSWTNQFTLEGGSFSFVIISRDGMRAIAGGANGLYYSATGGQSWLPTYASGNFNSASISSNSIKMVAGGVSGIWYSSNGGQNWAQGSLNSNVVNSNVDKVVISGDGKNAVAGGSTGSFGLLYSIDSGKTWTQSSKTNNNFPSIVINNDGTKAIAANLDNNSEGLWYSECTEQIIPCSTDFDLLNERRKAEILKYKANSSNITKKQQYANAASNRWLTGRKRSWATQTDTYTNPNTSALQRVGNVLECNNNNVRCTLTSGANVPGKVQTLCYNPTVPLYNYKVTRTYNGGGKYGLYGRVQVVSLSDFNNITKTIINDRSFDLTPPTSNSPGAFTYTSSNDSVATISGITVSIVGIGSCIITATQAAYSNYTSGSISALLTVNKIKTILYNFEIPPPNNPKTYGDAPFILIPANSNRPSSDATPITYNSSDINVATVETTINLGVVTVTVAIVGVGYCTFKATQLATDDYSGGTATTEILTVNKFKTILHNFEIPPPNNPKTYGDAPFILIPATSNRPSSDTTPITYNSSNINVATVETTINLGVVTVTVAIVGAGYCTFKATQLATDDYSGGMATTDTFTVNRATPKFLSGFSIDSKDYGEGPFTIKKPKSTSPGTFSYSSNNIKVATIEGNTITIVGASVPPDNCIITATQKEEGNYGKGSISAQFTVNPIAPKIDALTLASPQNYSPTPSPILITKPISTSPGTFSYSSSNIKVATIEGNTIIIVGASGPSPAYGDCRITATQEADGNYTSGSVSAPFIVNPIAPTIDPLTLATPQNYSPTPSPPISITKPNSTSQGAFTYSSNNHSVADIPDKNVNQITIGNAGNCTITANQAADGNYTSGSVSAPFTVNKIAPTISLSSLPIYIQVGAEPLSLKKYTTSSNLEPGGTFSYTSSVTSVATINEDALTPLAEGTTSITAYQAETANYNGGSCPPVTSNVYTPTSIYTVTPPDPDTSSYGDPPQQPTTGANIFGEVSISIGDILVSATTQYGITYNSSANLYLYFFSFPAWVNTYVVETVTFPPSSTPLSTVFNFPKALTWTHSSDPSDPPAATNYYMIWSQFDVPSQTGANPNLRMVITDEDGRLPSWQWGGGLYKVQK